MGISTQSKVAFICRDDESAWAERLKEKSSVPGAGYWEHEDNMNVPCELLENRSNGQVLIFNSDYYGIIGPARMDLPVSLQAVVCQSYSCQGEEQDPIYAVTANNVRAHDFSDLNPALKSCWFGLENERTQLQIAIDEAAEENDGTYSSDDFYDSIETLLISRRDKAFEDLVTTVEQMAELPTPFSDNPELATYLGHLKSINSDDADSEDWMTDYDGSPMPPASSAYTNEDVINHEHAAIDLSEILTEEQVASVNEKYETAKKAKELFDAETAAFKPITKGFRSRADIREAFLKAAVEGEEDTTGIWTLLKTKAGTGAYPPHGTEMQRLVMYIAARLEKRVSNLANEIETATEGSHVYNLINYVVLNRKWEKFELPTEVVKEEVKVETPKDPIKELEAIDENYNMLILISDDDYSDCIAGDPDEEGDWEAVLNQATDTQCWRYKPAKAYLNENGERLTEDEHAEKYKMSLDVITFVECCYSPKWADGFDYYPLWEAAMSDGSIDGDEVDVDQLSQMIKARKYWMGDNGGYVITAN